MTCADARELILTADLPDVRGETDVTLRAHLAECASCAAAASRVIRDTTRLRSALAARGRQPVAAVPRPSRIRFVLSLIPVAVAAEITLIAVLADRDARPAQQPPVLIASAPADAVNDHGTIIRANVMNLERAANGASPNAKITIELFSRSDSL